MVDSAKPSPSVPKIIANFFSFFKRASLMLIELCRNAIATVLKPCCATSSMPLSSHVHGIRKIEPIETRTARRLKGSHELLVNSIPSIPSAAAERKIAPIFVVSTTPSIMAMREAVLQMLSTEGRVERFIAHKTPRLSV